MAAQVIGAAGNTVAACPYGCGVYGTHYCQLAPGPSGFAGTAPPPPPADARDVVDALRDIAAALRESPRIVVVPVDAGGEIAPEALDQLVDALAATRIEAKTDCRPERDHVTGPGDACDPEE